MQNRTFLDSLDLCGKGIRGVKALPLEEPCCTAERHPPVDDASGLPIGFCQVSGPVFVPIVLRMGPEDHHALLQGWYGRKTDRCAGGGPPSGMDAAFKRLQALQDHLCAYQVS
jgi:hypothetical protein